MMLYLLHLEQTRNQVIPFRTEPADSPNVTRARFRFIPQHHSLSIYRSAHDC